MRYFCRFLNSVLFSRSFIPFFKALAYELTIKGLEKRSYIFSAAATHARTLMA